MYVLDVMYEVDVLRSARKCSEKTNGWDMKAEKHRKVGIILRRQNNTWQNSYQNFQKRFNLKERIIKTERQSKK